MLEINGEEVKIVEYEDNDGNKKTSYQCSAFVDDISNKNNFLDNRDPKTEIHAEQDAIIHSCWHIGGCCAVVGTRRLRWSGGFADSEAFGPLGGRR